jgi:CheY-like chemotaxis protein
VKTCLIVEDDPDNAALLSLALGKCGIPSVVARTGTEAMRFFWAAVDDEQPFGVILTDCAIPRLSGWNVVANVRRAERDATDLPKAVVVGYTGYGAQAETFISDRDFTLFDRMFTKPADPSELITLIERAAKGECLD